MGSKQEVSGNPMRVADLKRGQEILGIGEVIDVDRADDERVWVRYRTGDGAEMSSRLRYDSLVTVKPEPPDQTDAAAYVGIEAASRIADIRALVEIGQSGRGSRRDDELESLGVSFDEVGCADVDDAWDRLHEMPLCVEATTTFEIVLGVGGPDSRLLIECSRVAGEGIEGDRLTASGDFDYEIRRVLFRYSWEGTGEIELTGEDREVAESFARRVVPELVE